jgi:squalene synthase HpnC
MVQASSENFPVASWFLPRAVRSHLLAVYGFARLTDDIGDEAEGDRVVLLDWLEDELEAAPGGRATHPIMRRVGRTISELDLPLEPFRALITANRRDQTVTRYATYDDLVGYCMLSAAPVGQLVLAILGLATPERIARSDQVCIGLQLVEHIQDIAEDAGNGRVYMPLEDLRSAGCDVSELRQPVATAGVRRLVAREVERASALLAATGPLAATLPLRARVAVSGFGAGGMAALDAVRKAGYDVLATPCRPRPVRVALRLLSTLGGR